MNRQIQRRVYGLASAVALLPLLGSRVCAQETPQTANRFCDSIGINTHLFGGTTPYNSGPFYSFYNNVQLPLAWLGVRHIRDYMSVDDAGALGDSTSNPGYMAIYGSGYTASSDTMDDYYNRLRTLGNQGVKCDLSMYPVGWSWQYGDMARESSIITNTFLLGCQEAAEGANEWDGNEPTSDWATTFNSETNDTWNYYRGNASTAGIQIYSGTIIDLRKDVSDPNNVKMVVSPDTADYVNGSANSPAFNTSNPAYGTVSSKVDYGNCHVYSYSKGPNDPDDNMAAQVSGSSPLWGSSGPFVITETGYYTGTKGPNSQFPVSPIVQEKYTLRTLFSAFNLGAYRTYLFELYDLGTDTTNQEQNFGLIQNNGTNKPAYTALECLTQLLGDASTSTAVTPLTWSLGGKTTNVKHTLLQKSDGSYYLALWLGVGSTDTAQSQAVTVTVPSTIAAGTLYTINQYGSMSSSAVTIKSGKMSLNVTDTVSLLKLTGPIVESTPLALSQTTVSRSGGVVTATVTFQNVSSASMTILPYIAARDAQGNNDDFGSGGNGNVTLAPGKTVSVSVTKTLATWMNTGTWSVFGSYETPSNGNWYSPLPILPLVVTN